MSDLFQSGKFTLHSGMERDWKIECDSLSDNEIDTLVKMALPFLPPFSELVSVPTGGDRIVKAMTPFITKNLPGHRLVVDDVLTSGGSIEEVYDSLPIQMMPTCGFVFFSCKANPPLWVIPLFTMGHLYWWNPPPRA